MKVLLILLLLPLFAACGAQAPFGHSEGPELNPPVVTRTAPAVVDRGPVVNIRMLPALIRVDAEPLFFAMDGLAFDTIYVLPGDEVYEGQLLATLQTERQREQIANQERLIARLNRAHNLAAEIWEIDYALIEIRYIERMHAAAEEYNQAAMDEARNLYLEMDRSRLIREQEAEWQRIERADAYARLAEMREDIRYTELLAPFDGIVTYIAPPPRGASVNTVTPIVYLAPVDATPFVEYMGWTFTISGPERIFLHNVQRFTAEINGQIIDLEYITPTREEMAYNALHSLLTRTRFTLPQGYDFPMGSSVRLFVYLTHIEDTLRIPANALFIENGVPYVYRWENEAWVPVRPTFGARSTAFTEVLDGLSEGDVLLVN
ncbi:MAG: hypothetical protein FWE90_07845 [Defluviitaleaceae bacterium]|nr:hypothetical protein [Defluviitaleaceae bacterium]